MLVHHLPAWLPDPAALVDTTFEGLWLVGPLRVHEGGEQDD